MSVNPISGTQPASTQTSTTTGASGLTDYNQFLKLFLTQLKYQDPLSPQSQDEFMAQTAQFSALEQLVSLNTRIGELSSATQASAASLIGRTVSGTVTDANGVASDVSGRVAQVDYGKKGALSLGLEDGTTVSFANVTSVAEA
ncbi:MAG: flagellar hook capping protein [Deltaproteobacteria bacterium]|nr:flagellar hook capping protein [Deltaproteobacteria bacterium]